MKNTNKNKTPATFTEIGERLIEIRMTNIEEIGDAKNQNGQLKHKQIQLPVNSGSDPDNINEKRAFSRIAQVEEYLNSKYEFRFNVIANKVESRLLIENDFKEISEANIYRELQHIPLRFSHSDLKLLLASNDFVKPYNPIKLYFNELPEWDGQTDHIQNLCSFIKAKDQERFQRHLKKALVRCVACALGRTFNKHIFVLLGDQSGGKSTFTRWLCPEKLNNQTNSYYSENFSFDKDGSIALSQNFIINLDELAAIQKSEINALKSTLSKDSVKVRHPYGTKPTLSKRIANFFGSTNKEEFLNDETGSVRWLCFEIEEIDWAYSTQIMIDNIWAQAYCLLNSGFPYQLSAQEIHENEVANAAHQINSDELELVQKYFAPATKQTDGAKAFAATDIKIRLGELGHQTQRLSVINIGRALRLIGAKRVSERVGDKGMSLKVYWLIQKPITSITTNDCIP